MNTGKSDTLVGGYQAPARSSLRRSPSLREAPTSSLPRLASTEQHRKDEWCRCLMLEFDAKQKRWIDRFREPRARGVLPRRGGRTVPAPLVLGASTKALLFMGVSLLILPPVGVLLTWASPEIPLLGKKSVTWLGALVLILQAFLLGILALRFGRF